MTAPASDPQALLLEALPRVEKIVTSYGRRHGLSPEDTEDLAGEVKLKLLADNCAVLRRFEGRSSLDTYLNTVIHHLMLDLRTAQSGRWRASVGAQALGGVGVDLEREIDRSGRSTDEAVALVASQRGLDPAVVAAVAQRLPVRAQGRSRPAEGVDLDQISSSEPDPEAHALASTLQRDRVHVERVLAEVLAQLPPRERLILRLRFGEGLGIQTIADLLQEPRRPFYREISQLVAKLRAPLEARGVAAVMVHNFLDLGDFGVALDDVPDPKASAARGNELGLSVSSGSSGQSP